MAHDDNKSRLHPLYTSNSFNEACHPNAPCGSGGCGLFTYPGPLGLDPARNNWTRDMFLEAAKNQ